MKKQENEKEKIKINQGTYAIAHIQTRSIVVVGAQSGDRLAFTPEAARALAGELMNLAELAEGQVSAEAPMMTAFGPNRTQSVRM